jgi:decaprenyl-phosphate phosphoribosyltransferase
VTQQTEAAPTERAEPRSMSLAAGLIRTARPVQWSKNLLVFAAPAAAGVLDNREEFGDAMVAFVAFCLAASGTYFLNDAADVEADRRHPKKRTRPIAAGVVPIGLAWVLGALLVAGGIGLAFVPHWHAAVIVASYVALTTTYSFWLKHVPVFDLVAIAAGFVLRAIGGGAATGVPISDWFFIVASFGSLLVVAGKREGEASELQGDAAGIRSTLGIYSDTYLAYLRAVSSGVVLVAYCLWAFEKADLAGDHHFPWFQLSIVPFALGILRYALLLDQGRGSTPEEIALTDRTFQGIVLGWIVLFGCGIYLT